MQSGLDGGSVAAGMPEDEVEAAKPKGWVEQGFFLFAVFYAGWHLYSLNIAPLETWTFRIAHIAGALVLGFGLSGLLAISKPQERERGLFEMTVGAAGLIAAAWSLICLVVMWLAYSRGVDAGGLFLSSFGPALAAGAVLGVAAGWVFPAQRGTPSPGEFGLIIASIVGCAYLVLGLEAYGLRLRAGTPFADPNNAWAAFAIVVLILELTRRLAGMALLVIAVIFVAYSFFGPYLPGFFEHRGYDAKRFFTYIMTDNGVLGPTTAVSSTYIILFIIFAAFLQRSKVADYFVDLAFATAGRARGGPAKVAVFASGLMGMINGTSAGNVVSTGSLTIPLMKRVGYKPKTAGAVEAAASTGGQIMPPIMGAGAFIMAEITGIAYTDIVIAALIPAVLYFGSIYLMVDFSARKLNLERLPEDALPKFTELATRLFLFIPIVILVGALFMGYTVIRGGTLAIAAAAVVSWLTPHRMGPMAILDALGIGARMAVQIIIVCAAAGVIVGVISLTGVGARFSSLLFALAEQSQILGLIFAMMISIILGMGMPTTAAYAVAASVVAPGLIQLGIEPLLAHFFVFYFAVVSAITPPVALAAYAGAGIAGSEPMETAVESFKVGLAAVIVPFMVVYSPGLVMEAAWYEILRNAVTAIFGIGMLAAAVQGWWTFGRISGLLRLVVLAGALCMISGDWRTDLLGFAIAAVIFVITRRNAGNAPASG